MNFDKEEEIYFDETPAEIPRKIEFSRDVDFEEEIYFDGTESYVKSNATGVEVENEIYIDYQDYVLPDKRPWNDECIQNAGPEIISKCIYAYGNIPEYKKYGRLHDLFKNENNTTLQKNFTEICLKEVFNRCYYDAMFQIRMNSKKVIGVQMDVDFNEEFEIDSCDSQTVAQLITQIKTCHQHDLQIPISSLKLLQSNDLTCSILADATFCVEDHTAYTCIFNDRKLFKEIMICLMQQLKDYSLQRLQNLEYTVSTSLNSTRFCLNCLDYFRAEHCEEDFYEYITCLRNKSLNQALYAKVCNCFQESYSACSQASSLLLINILANAVVGYHPAFSKLGFPSGVVGNVECLKSYICTDGEIYSWSLEIKQCMLLQQNTLNNMEWSLRCLLLCIKKSQQKQCHLSKFSQFELAVQCILNVFKDCCDASVKATDCAIQCDYTHLKECIVKFFLYYVSMQHVRTNQWRETIDMQLGKVKICMQTTLNICSFRTVQSFIKVLAAILMIEVPDVKPGVVTTVRFDNDIVWCSTTPKTEWITLPEEPAVIDSYVLESPCTECGPWILVENGWKTIEDIIIQSDWCISPCKLECRIVSTHDDYIKSQQVITCDINKGFMCHCEYQTGVCPQYEIRLWCCERAPPPLEIQVIPFPTRWDDYLLEYPLPATEQYFYIPERNTYHDVIIPTVVQYIEVPVRGSVVKYSYPKAQTSFQTYTAISKMYKDKFIKQQPKIVQYTVPSKVFHDYHTQTTSKIEFIKPKTKKYEDSLYYTTKKYQWTKSSRSYEEHRKNTELAIAPVQTKIYEHWEELPQTRMEHFTPKCNEVWFSDWCVVEWNCSISMTIQQILSKCGKCEELDSIECRIREQNIPITENIICDALEGFKCQDTCNGTITGQCCCSEYEIRIVCCGYHEQRTEPPPTTIYIPAKVHADHKTMLPLHTKVVRYSQKPHKYFHHYDRIPTDVVHVTIPERVFTDQKTQTTVKLKVQKPKLHTFVNKVLVPPTEVYRYTVGPKFIDQHKTGTTTKSHRISKKPKVHIEQRPMAVTRIVKYPAKSKSFRYHWTPTTSRVKNVPLTKKYHKQILKIPTQIEHFTESTKSYQQHVTPTEVEYVTIPVEVQTFTAVKNQTQMRYIWKEIKPKEEFFEVPLPSTEVVHYNQNVKIYEDYLEPTTTRIEIVEPIIETQDEMVPLPVTYIEDYTLSPCENTYSDWFQVVWNCSMSMTFEDIASECGKCETVDIIECRIRNADVTDNEYFICNTQDGFRCMDVCSETFTDACCCSEYEIRAHCACEQVEHLAQPMPEYGEFIAQIQHHKHTYPPLVPEKKVYEIQDSLHPKKSLMQWPAEEKWFTQKWHQTTSSWHVKIPPIIFFEDDLEAHTDYAYYLPDYERNVYTQMVQAPTPIRNEYIPLMTESYVAVYAQPDLDEECNFIPSEKKTINSCYRITRPKEICTIELLDAWQKLIRNCSLERLARRGFNVGDHVYKHTMQILRATVAVCLRVVGDTACRNSNSDLINLVFESDVIIFGKITDLDSQHKWDTPYELKQCILLSDKEKINFCCPGLYDILENVVVHGHTNVTFQIDKFRDMSCLLHLMEHCESNDLQALEEILYSIFGVCIKMTESNAGGCVNDIIENKYCIDSDVNEFIQQMNHCLEQSCNLQEFPTFSFKRKCNMIQQCMSSCPVNCIFSKWEVFHDVLSFLVNSISEGCSEDCAQQLSMENIKTCAQNLISITSTLHDTRLGMIKGTMQSVGNCFRRTLNSCDSDICEQFLSILESLTNSAHLTGNYFPPLSYRTINSVKVFGNELDICESVSQDDLNMDPNITPETESDTPVKYVIQKSCRGHDIGKWLEKVKSCMHTEAKSVGLKNLEKLTVESMMSLLQNCIKKQNHLNCHPKGRKEYRILLNSFLNTLRRFSVSSSTSTCHKHLMIEKIGKCQNSLYSFLFLKYHSSLIKQKIEALQCLQESFKDCSPQFVEKILGIFDECIYPEENPQSYSKNYTTCEPDDPAFYHLYNRCDLKILRNSYLGPNSIKYRNSHTSRGKIFENSTQSSLELRQVEKSLQPIKYHKSSIISNTKGSIFIDEQKSDIHGILEYKSIPYCSKTHFMNYFDALTDCQSIRMELLLYFEGTNCNNAWMEKSLESLILCLLEDKGNKLSCKIYDKKQMEDYLEILSEKLDQSRRFKGDNCPTVKPCYGTTVPSLSNCTNVLYEQFISNNKSIILSEGNLSSTLQCLKTVWPYCSIRMLLLTLPPLYTPIGVDLKEILKETEDQKCISNEIKPPDTRCTDTQKKTTAKDIYECLEKTIKGIEKSIKAAKETVHWQLLPLTVCVTVHPILECREKNHNEFKQYMLHLSEGIKMRLKKYLRIFDDPLDKQQGEKCIEQFSSQSLDKCLSVMFGYMTKFHEGFTKISDYPPQCVEETFKVCGDIDTFHLFMKKSMNLSRSNDIEMNEVSVRKEACIQVENYDSELHPCLLTDFKKSLSLSTSCPFSNEENFTSFQNALKLCKNCVLNNVNELCFYDLPDLISVVTLTFKPLKICLQKLKVHDKCIDDLTYRVKDNCISRFYLYTVNIKRGSIMKASQFAKEFYVCLRETVKRCPHDAFKAIYNFYNKISGLEMVSKFKSVPYA
ncbi:uncharacterized protein NPIL_580602 [Nephila pilipes]|uniref:WxxW domain-containing protein n=1 Tax=Nephila pilipes TaxID=299642 RepID=A0A8X6ITY5_NEPPI|nr:uncharacterized protein NPIL_580602 [Nephila pilipes]